MTDDTLDPRDELASAHLDGETTPEEAARVVADPEIGARVDAFAAVRAAVRGAGEAVDEDRREQAIAAALAAGTVVTPIGARRRVPRWAPAVGAAAAALLAALLIPLLSRDDEPDAVTASGKDEAATTTTVGAPGAEAFSLDAAAPEAGTGLAAGTGAAGGARLALQAPVSLGRQVDLDALVASARAVLDDTATSEPTAAPPGPSDAARACLEQLAGAAEGRGSGVVLAGTAELAGEPVAFVVEQDAAGDRTLVAVDPAAGCAPVASAAL